MAMLPGIRPGTSAAATMPRPSGAVMSPGQTRPGAGLGLRQSIDGTRPNPQPPQGGGGFGRLFDRGTAGQRISGNPMRGRELY